MEKKVVAIFEDDAVNRFIYERMFKKQKDDIELFIFDNADKGIVKSKEISFDIVFIEVHFWENFGGLKILKKLKESGAENFTAIALTSLLQSGDLERIMEAGFTMCMEKPVVFSESLGKII